MDTDDLSKKAYEGIILEAERFNHNLALQFGLISYNCLDENQYFEKSIELINTFRELKAEELEDIFYDEIPNLKSFKRILSKIENNIKLIKKTTLIKR